MVWMKIFLFFLMFIIQKSFPETMRSFRMSMLTGWQFQCENTTCLPFMTIITPNVRKCQTNCLAQIYCQAASFQSSISRCKLFAYIHNQYSNRTVHADVVTMIVIRDTRIPPEPTTTSTTSTSTSTTTSTTSKTTSTTSKTTSTTTTTVTLYPPCSRTFCCTNGSPTPCTYNGINCHCDTSGGSGTFVCPICAGTGPSEYMGSGTCYYSGYYYASC
ncbi:hypothetical protein I4U23_013500 [Adineta vaga]|nr:hypothetical protein I4U23_013500 [Adineta vaga]